MEDDIATYDRTDGIALLLLNNTPLPLVQ